MRHYRVLSYRQVDKYIQCILLHNNLFTYSYCESDMTCDTFPSLMNLFAENDDLTVMVIMKLILKVIWINQNMHWLRLFNSA